MRARLTLVAIAFTFAAAGTAQARPVEFLDASANVADAGADASKTAARVEETVTIGKATFLLEPIAAGTFTEGSAATDRWHEADETAHEVTLSKEFSMLRTPVTRGQFAAFVTDTGYVTEAENGASGGSGWNGTELVQRKEFTWKNPGFTQTDEHPVVLVTYADALAFVSWFSAKTGKTARLPTEAEYEYATRAGTLTAWYVSDDETAARTIGAFKTGHGTEPVGTHVPNAWGLHDMSGNVYEWCSDVYAPYPTGAKVDPKNETPDGKDPLRRVLRGGSWLKDPKRGRSAARYRNTPGSRNADNGFRFVVVSGGALGATAVGVPPLGTPTSTPAPTAPSAPSGDDGDVVSWLGGMWGVAGIAGLGAALAWLIFRKKNPARAPARPPTPGSLPFVVVADGFRLQTPGLGPGSRVRYECVVNGTPITDVVPVGDGPETFIYTGGPPMAIRIVEIVPVVKNVRGAFQPQRPHPPVRSRNDDDDRPFGGFPSAY